MIGFPQNADFVHNSSRVYINVDKDSTEPLGYPDYHQFHLMDMYTRASSEKMKEKVMKSFITAGSKLKILIAAIAFSMG